MSGDSDKVEGSPMFLRNLIFRSTWTSHAWIYRKFWIYWNIIRFRSFFSWIRSTSNIAL